MTLRTIVSFLIAFTLAGQAYGQEILRPIQSNPPKELLKDQLVQKSQPSPTLVLPFREDFSYKGPYPDSKLWADKYVYINPSFAVHPKTIGTATFDALNEFGQIYPEAENDAYQFSADMLTSHYIRLDSVFHPAPMALSPADSVILTFYYQPQGHGTAPRDRDSLVVEFLHTPAHYQPDPENPDSLIWIEDMWESIWRAEGQPLEAFVQENNGNYLRRVAIPIEDEVFFRKDFRLRFRNYASFPIGKVPDNYAGNTSIWNIDYILLDYGRQKNDPFYYDIAFAAPAQSILKDYQAMPWSHYIANPQRFLRNRFDVTITNLDNTTYNYVYNYFIRDEAGSNIINYSGNFFNIAPFYSHGYQTYEAHSNPIVIPNPLPTAPAPAREFTIYHTIREGAHGDEWRRNDTITFRQAFDNYFAYDNGIPENGYGLVGHNAKGAVRFILSHTDTLHAVKFFFNRTLYDQNEKPFLVKVWKDLDPETVLYESEAEMTEFADGISKFVTYPLEEPIEVSDTIYVGWQQVTNDFLNIGFDFSNNASSHIYYNTHGEWIPTIYQGALMIRPVLGQQQLPSSIPDIHSGEKISIYPNPVRGSTLTIDYCPDTHPVFEARIMDVTGKVLRVFQNQNQLNISGLADGLYFLQFVPSYGKPQTSRFLISR